MKINERSNAYRRGYAHTKHKHHSLTDNPYREGTKDWNAWRAGFEKSCVDFTKQVIVR